MLLSSLAAAGPYSDLDARQGRMTDAQVVAEARRLGDGDPEAEASLGSAKAARAYVGLRADLEEAGEAGAPKVGPPPGGERIASSWLSRALSRLKRPEIEMPEMRSAPRVGVVAPWATTVMWALLAALLGLAVVLLARTVRLPKGRRRAMVEDDEPLRSADAWLEEANARIARGEHREAVRGLYVAGLMRLDEAGVARFDRHQTNWEHLRRIEASPKGPEGADVREATGRFDRLWYGLAPAGEADARAMRDWYDALVRRLGEGPA